MERFLTKENVFIIALCLWAIVQSNYFATKIDLANVKLEMSEMRTEMQQYSDKRDEEILKQLEIKYEKIITKLDRLK